MILGENTNPLENGQVVLQVAGEVFQRGTVCGDQEGKGHYKEAWGRCGSFLHSTAFPATQSNKYLLSVTLPTSPWPSLSKSTQICSSCGVCSTALEILGTYLKRHAHNFQYGAEGTTEI